MNEIKLIETVIPRTKVKKPKPDRKSGVYKLTNPEGLIYIGSSNNIIIRIKEYKYLSTCKNQRGLYESYLKHGQNGHVVEIIEFCEPDQRLIRERYWQDTLDTVMNGLNTVAVSIKGMPSIIKPESIKRRKDSYRKYLTLNGSPFKGKKHTDLTKEKLRNSANIRYANSPHPLKGVPNPRAAEIFRKANLGRKHSDLHKQKLSAMRLANPTKMTKIIDTNTGIIYPMVKTACEAKGISKSTLMKYLNGAIKVNKSGLEYYRK